MTINISVKEAKAALKKIKLLTPAKLKTDDEFMMTRKETVFFMAEELIRMIGQGFTLKELAAALIDQNIPIKYATLSRYLKEYQLERKKVSLDKPKQPLKAIEDAQAEFKNLVKDADSAQLIIPENSNSAVKNLIIKIETDEDNQFDNYGESELSSEKYDCHNLIKDEIDSISNTDEIETDHDKNDSIGNHHKLEFSHENPIPKIETVKGYPKFSSSYSHHDYR